VTSSCTTNPPPPPPSSGNGGTNVNLGSLQIPESRVPSIYAHTGVPVDTSSWNVVSYTGARTGSAVEAAIDAAAPNTVIELPAGTYTGVLKHKASNVVVRGQCSDISAVTWENSGVSGGSVWGGMNICSNGWINMCGGDFGDSRSTMFPNEVSWTGGHARGETTLTLSSASAYAVGDKVLMTSPPLVGSGENAQISEFTYIAQVVSRSGNTITIDRGLPIAFNPSGAQVSKIKLQENAGIECMTVRDTEPNFVSGEYYNSSNLRMDFGWNTWVKDIDFGDTYHLHGGSRYLARSVIMNSRFGEQTKANQGDGNTCDLSVPSEFNPCWNKSTFTYQNGHDNSFINNVVTASIGVQPVSGSSRLWIAYNYFPEPLYHPNNEPRRAIFHHGFYGYENVSEGNDIWGQTKMDTTWGTQGPRNTFFRNKLFGPVARYAHEGNLFSCTACSRLSVFANYLLNYGRQFSFIGGGSSIDGRSDDMWLERNVYTASNGMPTNNVGLPAAQPNRTTRISNYNASSVPLGSQWNSLSLPNTLNENVNGVPDFWCQETVSNGGQACDFALAGGIGALWNGSCKLPAQVRNEGGTCTPTRGTGGSSPPPPPPPSSGLSLNLTPRLESRSVSGSDSFSVRVYQQGGASALLSWTGSGSTIALPSNTLSSGSYDIEFELQGHLTQRSTHTLNSSTITLPELLAGDVNNDNVINSLDWSVMSPQWFTNNSQSDLNGDGTVNSIDFSYLNKNWGEVGD
tara:strand:- start:14542 stop:16764 length:2223 start_codon:yes stop_codon:yes gene_type:complete